MAGVQNKFAKRYSQMYYGIKNLALQVGCGLTQYSNYLYLITHNVSSEQSPITINRDNVTLYGVQPGKIYTVEIIPRPFLLHHIGEPSNICFNNYAASFPEARTAATIPTTACTVTMRPITNTPTPSTVTSE